MTRAAAFADLAVTLADLVPALDHISDRFHDAELPSYAETASDIADTLRTQASHMAQLAAKYTDDPGDDDLDAYRNSKGVAK